MDKEMIKKTNDECLFIMNKSIKCGSQQDQPLVVSID